ncbi:MAG: putative CRISPR-associated protein [Candidatus Desulfofervidus auxilii]|nr:putative CRISPR-associated protein [Candidatus Desulfofervidus auxilii]
MKKEFHLITVGNSLIANYQKNIDDSKVKNAGMGDEIWLEVINDSSFFKKIYDFLSEKPRERSAELNSFLKYCEKHSINPATCEIYLSGTQTASNEIALRTIEKYFKEGLNCAMYSSPQFPGYFDRPLETAADEFIKGLTDILDRFIYLASKKKKEGYKVVFNPTGGFKAHVITSALAGFLTGCEVYYMHEEFKDIIKFPPLFYLPRGNELKVLEMLSDKKTKSNKEFEELINKYADEINRLEHYGLVEVERGGIRITNKGIWTCGCLKEGK